MSSSNDDFDEDPNCSSPLSYEAVLNCLRKILPVEIKMSCIYKQRFLQYIPAERSTSPDPQIGENVEFVKPSPPNYYSKHYFGRDSMK